MTLVSIGAIVGIAAHVGSAIFIAGRLTQKVTSQGETIKNLQEASTQHGEDIAALKATSCPMGPACPMSLRTNHG